MSHLTLCEQRVDDLDSLRGAAVEMGGQLIKVSTYRWFGRSVGDYPIPAGMKVEDMGKCDYAIKFNGIDYEVGVVKQADGKSYKFIYDFYGNGRYSNEVMGGKHDGERLKQKVGDNCGKLAQIYGVHRQMAVGHKMGMMVQRKTKKDGTIQVVCS